MRRRGGLGGHTAAAGYHAAARQGETGGQVSIAQERTAAAILQMGVSVRTAQVLHELARYECDYRTHKSIAAELPLGRAGKAAHPKTISRIVRLNPHLIKSERVMPGQRPHGATHRSSYGTTNKTLILKAFDIVEPKTQRPFNVNTSSRAPASRPASGPRMRSAPAPRTAVPFEPRASVEVLPPDELELALSELKAALNGGVKTQAPADNSILSAEPPDTT